MKLSYRILDIREGVKKMSTTDARPEFSIITVTLNSESTLQRCIDSLKAQSYQDFEYIIIDGVSQDSTVQIAQANSEVVSTLVSEVDSGLYDAMNKGILIARGRYVGILNSDDEYLPETLSLVRKHLESNPDSQVIYGDLYLGEGAGNKLIVELNEISTRMIPHPTVFVSLGTYRKYGAFNTAYRVAADYELMLRLRLVGAKFLKLDSPLAVMHPGGFSAKHKLRSVLETCALRIRFRETYFHLAFIHSLRYLIASYAPRILRRK
jgi:glycosyltransferase involved in cell wall biosynthesis